MTEEIVKAFEVLKNGGIILYPTDTIWGIGCDPTNAEAVAKIYALKKRAESKSMIVLVNGDRMMHSLFNEIPEVAWQIMELSETPTTLVLDKPKNVTPSLIAPDNTLAVRMVKEVFCYKLLERFKKPLVSTSANLTGDVSPKSFKDIHPDIIKGVDYVVNWRRDEINTKPSSIIKLSGDSQVKVLR